MRYKIIMLLMILTLCGGWKTNYNLKINKTNIEEKIEIIIKKSVLEKIYSSDNDDQESSEIFIIGEDIPVFKSDSIVYEIYNKNVSEDIDSTKVILTYTYDYESFKSSYFINKCFEKSEFNNKQNFYDINLNGTFSCSSDEEIDINIETYKKASNSNSNLKNSKNYKWIIPSNAKKYDINIQIRTKYNDYITIFIIIVIILLGIYIVYKKSKKNNQI